MKLRLSLLSLSFFLLAQTCGKEMQLPNHELKKLFGRWEWVETSGGFAGKIITPAKAGYSEEVEFSKEGLFLKYKNGNLSDKKKFTIGEGKSIFKVETAYIMSFSNVDSLFSESLLRQSVSVSGNDTLYLNEECNDCFGHMYVRKK